MVEGKLYDRGYYMEKIEFKNSIRFKLILITLFLVIIPITTVAIIYSQTVRNIIRKKYSQSAIQLVYETGKKFDYILNDIEEFSNVVMANKDFLDSLNHPKYINDVEFESLLRNFLTAREDIDGINVMADNLYYSVGVTKVTERENFPIPKALAESQGELIWTKTQQEKIKILSGEFDKYYLSLSRKIIDYNTLEELGYLTIDIDESILEQYYKSLVTEDGGEVFICDGYGQIISHTNKSKIGLGISNKYFMSDILLSESKYGSIPFKQKNVDKVAIYTTIDTNGWKIIKIIPSQYLYKELNQIQSYLFIAGIIYVVIIILFISVFSLKYTEPIIRMTKVIKKAEGGNLDVRTNVNTKDEIGQLGSSFNNMIQEMQVLMSQLVEEEKLKKTVELEALHSQINPHFMYNTLNTIKWMAKIQGAKTVSTALTALIKLLRISTNLGREMILFKEEIEYLKNYVLIQKLRFNESFDIQYHIAQDCENCNIPKLMLQPIVENAIIYGMKEDSLDTVHITIEAYKIEGKLRVEIHDDGPGIPPEQLKNIFKSPEDKDKFSKVGLNNIHHRIKLYYGNEYGITIQTKVHEGTNVILEIPFVEEGPL